MLYQSILPDEAPYQIMLGGLNLFAEHRHADIELNYCVSGSFEITIDKRSYFLTEGQMTFIPPMVSHGIPEQAEGERIVLTTVVGSSFLKRHFSSFCEIGGETRIVELDHPNERCKRMKELILENAELYRSPGAHSDLIVTGNLYKLCAYLMEELAAERGEAYKDKDGEAGGFSDLRKVANIEKALELIYYRYSEPLSVELAALETGYGKSNFCKIFKNVVGDTFHNVLNRQRIKNACGLLRETDMPVYEVGQSVGFMESKTFCRVFRAVMGNTPGEYRKENGHR